MHIKCPHCEQDVQADKLKDKTNYSKCPICGYIFTPKNLDNFSPHSVKSKRFDIVLTDKSAEITTNKRSLGTIISSLFMISYFLYLVKTFITNKECLKFYFFAYSAIIGLTYWALATILNKIRIIVSSQGIRIIDRPLPLPGRKFIPISAIRMIFFEEMPPIRKKIYCIWLEDKRKNKKPLKLVTHLETVEEAVYLKSIFKKYLSRKK